MAALAPHSATAPAAAYVGAATGGVRATLRLEGFALLAAAVAGYAQQGFGWGWFALLFFAPDLTFAGYLLGPRWGALAYNALHSTVGPLALGALGFVLGSAPLEMIALIGLAHIGFDRALGYGLKYATAFGDTHLSPSGR